MKIKGLDRNKIYDLRGITHEQAEELLKWLIENDKEWDEIDLEYLVSHNNIFFDTNWNEWLLCYGEYYDPTTHISTLFEPSYEDQLIESVKRVEILKEKVKKLKEPEVGDVCKFWDDEEEDFVIGKLSHIDTDIYPYLASETNYYKYSKKITQQEVIELLFNKKQ